MLSALKVDVTDTLKHITLFTDGTNKAGKCINTHLGDLSLTTKWGSNLQFYAKPYPMGGIMADTDDPVQLGDDPRPDEDQWVVSLDTDDHRADFLGQADDFQEFRRLCTVYNVKQVSKCIGLGMLVCVV